MYIMRKSVAHGSGYVWMQKCITTILTPNEQYDKYIKNNNRDIATTNGGRG